HGQYRGFNSLLLTRSFHSTTNGLDLCRKAGFYICSHRGFVIGVTLKGITERIPNVLLRHLDSTGGGDRNCFSENLLRQFPGVVHLPRLADGDTSSTTSRVHDGIEYQLLPNRDPDVWVSNGIESGGIQDSSDRSSGWRNPLNRH